MLDQFDGLKSELNLWKQKWSHYERMIRQQDSHILELIKAQNIANEGEDCESSPVYKPKVEQDVLFQKPFSIYNSKVQLDYHQRMVMASDKMYLYYESHNQFLMEQLEIKGTRLFTIFRCRNKDIPTD